jgi:hypothetical protein
MIALLVATLIGVFITPDGIVIGADTALSDPGGHVGAQQKFCVTGPRSVATMQGSYLLEDTLTKDTIELNNRFRELCAQVGSSTPAMTLRQQADHIASALRADLVGFLGRLPAAVVASRYASSPVVARVAVTGYGDSGPESVVVGVGVAVEPKTNRWEAQAQSLLRLSFSECGVRFQGQESVVSLLRTDTGVRIPRSELQHADVAKLVSLLKGNCSQASIQSAQAMFMQAVRLTVTLGANFGVPQGTVGLPVDLVLIPREGAIEVKQVTSW